MCSKYVVQRSSILGVLQPDLKPWQRIDWPVHAQSRIFKDWGQYYTHRLFNKKALQCFGQALYNCKGLINEPNNTRFPRLGTSNGRSSNMAHEAYTTLHNRSRCFRGIAQAEAAYNDAERAQMLMELDGLFSSNLILAKCEALFECNRFEDNLYMLHMEARKFQGKSIKGRFHQYKNRTLTVLEGTLGDNLSPFLLENWPFIAELSRQRRKSTAFMPRPLWQKMRDHPECDVESIIYKEKVSLPPLERARRRVAENVYNYHYLGNSIKDIIMLRQLQNDKIFLNPHYPESTPNMSEYSSEQYKIIRKFMKMMHARQPLYQTLERNREKFLYRVESQTRRDCLRILRDVRRLRRESDIERLTDYVEKAMSTIVELKTLRTLPWKFEFINEIYNILALAHVDQRSVPRNVDFLDSKNHAILYMLPKDRFKDITPTFGGRNIYADLHKDEERLARVAAKVANLEERLHHSRYGIEKAYLMFEIARSHFKETRYDICTTMARNAVKEARNCNSIIWGLNSTFLICQVHAAFNRFERLRESLPKAISLAEKLKNPKLLAYLELCKTVNDYELHCHRKRQTEFNDQRRQRKRKESLSQSSAESEII